ncbi:MerR family transcriptional regulator [Clostridium tepidum]|uniref:MerR family transcriptional regulator n=1 Tax=Clostridium tepidum TaxID=1962263 RepID=A0A1S9I257_9CLOT|nr:MerR family transcriptional regulator [Clostridium tepidum]MCR1934813.1 MerR family transcriptional regulator [Clostridium tepidum]MDU6878348.1 MerR family transcriptional regulator [Clostridium botulinum]OOO62140.1 MerR family transcriptional regulator [Clostridium tepidum]OOO64335.1 MerR family transcriptional regulator [Clostridium tepidum]
MRTVKQVSDLTGISVRTLHYYDEIGLLKPSQITEAGYRLYDNESLKTLQQILFFKELDIPLKEIKEIMASDYFDKMKSLENQKKLLILKRNRLNRLIKLINKTLKGENTMSFKEFDMTAYYNVLEEFKKENKDSVIKNWGSIDKFDEMIEQARANESKIAKNAIKQFGSIEKYAKAIKKNLNSNSLSLGEEYDKFKKDCLYDRHPKLKELFNALVDDLSKDPTSTEIKQIAEEISYTAKKDYKIFKSEYGDYYWYYMVQIYLVYPDWIKEIDKKYGNGASQFIGKALKNCSETKKPKLERLYEDLSSDLSKDPTSTEIQQIVKEIVNETKKQNDSLKLDSGENYWEYITEFYLSNSTFKKIIDKKYGSGASQFIGEALKYYSENNK